MSELCVELWYGEQPNAIARQLNFCAIVFIYIAKLWCTLQLRGQRHSHCFPSPLPSS
jgi:hypothetical protein